MSWNFSKYRDGHPTVNKHLNLKQWSKNVPLYNFLRTMRRLLWDEQKNFPTTMNVFLTFISTLKAKCFFVEAELSLTKIATKGDRGLWTPKQAAIERTWRLLCEHVHACVRAKDAPPGWKRLPTEENAKLRSELRGCRTLYRWAPLKPNKQYEGKILSGEFRISISRDI